MLAAAAAGASSSPDLVELTYVRGTGTVKHRPPILGPVLTSPGHVTSLCRDDVTVEPKGGLAFRLTTETRRAIEAVQFVAAHLKNEDDYAEVTVLHALQMRSVSLTQWHLARNFNIRHCLSFPLSPVPFLFCLLSFPLLLLFSLSLPSFLLLLTTLFLPFLRFPFPHVFVFFSFFPLLLSSLARKGRPYRLRRKPSHPPLPVN